QQAPLMDDAESLRGLAIVLVDLRQALRELVERAVDGVIGRQLDQLLVREDAPHLAPEALVQAVVVVRVQEPPGKEVAAEQDDLFVREPDVAVTRDVDVRTRPERRVGELDVRGPLRDRQAGPLPDLPQEVGQRGRVRVPVAAAAVLELCDGEEALRGRGPLRSLCARSGPRTPYG